MKEKNQPIKDIAGAKIISASQHNISEKQINKNVLKILRYLNDAGFEAYLVGGGVRDLLLKRHPKDFDVATNALPHQIKKLFYNCRLIGRRFRLAHIHFGRDIIEVATLRASHEGAQHHEAHSHEGMVIRDNVYGSIDQDAKRRDFTVNALYYSIKDCSLIDFFHGFTDLQHKKLDVIGDPETRYREDPVRMLRAARIAGKLDLTVTTRTKEPILKLNDLLQKIPPARLFDETIKLFHTGASSKIFPLLSQYGLFAQLFPLTSKSIKKQPSVKTFINALLRDTDTRIHQSKPVAPAFLFAALLWFPLLEIWETKQNEYVTQRESFEKSTSLVISKQKQHTAISQNVSKTIREIWYLQHRLERRRPKFIESLFVHPHFRAAYDLLILRAKTNKSLKEHAGWWTQYQSASKAKQRKMIADMNLKKKKRG
jgi:poly(A) polymerase